MSPRSHFPTLEKSLANRAGGNLTKLAPSSASQSPEMTLSNAGRAGLLVAFLALLVVFCSWSKKRTRGRDGRKARASETEGEEVPAGDGDVDVEMGLGEVEVSRPERVYRAKGQSRRDGDRDDLGLGWGMGLPLYGCRGEQVVGRVGVNEGLEGRSGAGSEGVMGGVQLMPALEDLPAYAEAEGGETDERLPPYAA